MHVSMRTKHKAYAYVVRHKANHGPELLVFQHPVEEAGIQVPKGSIELDEAPSEALLRELFEESGISRVGPVRMLIADRWWDAWKSRWVIRHFYKIEPHAEASLPDEWVHEVSGDGEDLGMKFSYFWLPLEEAPTKVIAQMAQWAKLAR